MAGERPKYNSRQIDKYVQGLKLGNNGCREVLLKQYGNEEDEALKTRVQTTGLSLARASALSTSRYVSTQLKSYKKVGAHLERTDPKFANALRENNDGSAFFSGVLMIATTPSEQRGDLLAEFPISSVAVSGDILAEATSFVEDLETADRLASWFDTDPSGFTLVRDLLDAGARTRIREIDGIPDQSFVIEGHRGAADWYRAVYMRGYRAGLGPAPRLIPG